jgi:hypothetical protein
VVKDLVFVAAYFHVRSKIWSSLPLSPSLLPTKASAFIASTSSTSSSSTTTTTTTSSSAGIGDGAGNGDGDGTTTNAALAASHHLLCYH